MFGNSEPLSMEERTGIVQQKFEKRGFGRNSKIPKAPYKVGDVVQFQLPKDKVRKGQSPKSRPLLVTREMGLSIERWTDLERSKIDSVSTSIPARN